MALDEILLTLFFAHLRNNMGWTGETKIKTYKNGVLLFISTQTQEQAKVMNTELLKILNKYKSFISGTEHPIEEPSKKPEVATEQPKGVESEEKHD